LNKTELAYLAGLFDAEGSILIVRKEPGPRNKSRQYILNVTITNTKFEIVNTARQNFGGNIVGPIRQNPNHNPFFRWKLEGARARDFLRQVEPYLIIKRDLLALAFELQERIDTYGAEWHEFGSRPLTEQELSAREELYQRFRKMNRAGVTIEK
jgi:hypothetical protein